MIQLPTKAELQALRAWREPNCVTIYAPYITPNASDKNPNRTLLKDLIKESERILLDKKLGQREVDSILSPARKLVDESSEFTTSSKHSLVLFLHHDFFAYFHLPPDDVKQYAVVGKGFKLRPIARLLEDNMYYFVLHLSYNGVTLFKGDLYNIHKLKVQKTPTTMFEELNIDETPKESQLHIIAPFSSGRGSKRFHGQYDKTQVNKEMLERFFRRIDAKLNRRIKQFNLPLILAGVDYLLPIYRKINSYPHLVREEIRGNLEHLPLDTIREKACHLLIDNHISTKLQAIK